MKGRSGANPDRPFFFVSAPAPCLPLPERLFQGRLAFATLYNVNDEDFMRLALAEAAKARAMGEVPVGAVLVRDGALIAAGHNLRESERNPIAHAELLAIENAAASLDAWRLADATLYVTLEPCFMCAGAVILSRIRRLVYGCRDPRAGAFGSLADLNDYPLNHKVEVTEGVLQTECSHELKSFFRDLRAQKEKKAGSDST